MSETTSLTIDVVSDVVCPWCFLGQKRLEQAIEAVKDVDVTVRWRPFQLDPTIPAEGKDRKAYMQSQDCRHTKGKIPVTGLMTEKVHPGQRSGRTAQK